MTIITLGGYTWCNAHFQPEGVAAGVATLLTAIGFFPGVYADVPGDLLLVPGGVLAVGALVKPGAPVRAEVLLQHQLMAAGEFTVAALQWLVRPGAVFLFLLFLVLLQ